MVTHDHEEAFAVADRMAVMRAGRVVQQGTIDEVWRQPADAETALFLGYARGAARAAAARAVLAAAGLPDGGRRSPFGAPRSRRPDGELAGTVTSARVTPEQVRLEVDVDGVGKVDAVAPARRTPRRRAAWSGSPWTPPASPWSLNTVADPRAAP